MKFRRARECRFGVRPGTPGRVFASSPHAARGVGSRAGSTAAARTWHASRAGTRRSKRRKREHCPGRCCSKNVSLSVRKSRIRSSWFAARAAAARSPWRARPARDRGRAGPRARAAFRRGRAFFYAPAGGMRHGQWRRTTGRPGAARGPRPRPAGAETARSRPTRSARRRRRAPAVTSTWSAARGERSRRVRGSRERFRPSGSALQSPPATPQIRLH